MAIFVHKNGNFFFEWSDLGHTDVRTEPFTPVNTPGFAPVLTPVYQTEYPWLAGGGGGKYYPLRDIRHSSDTVPDISMKLSVPYETTIWCLFNKCFENRTENFWQNGVLIFSDNVSRDFR